MSERLALLLALAVFVAACAPLERVWYRCGDEASGRWIGWHYSAECQRIAGVRHDGR